MRVVSLYYNGMFSETVSKVPEYVMYERDVNGDSDYYMLLKNFMNPSDFICDSICVNNQSYKNGDLIVVDIEDSDNIRELFKKNCLSWANFKWR